MKRRYIIISLVFIILLVIYSYIMFNNGQKKLNNNSDDIKKDYNVKIIKATNNYNSDTEENYLISPYSIEIALSMLRDGADKDSYSQIENLIGNRDINYFNIKDRISVANATFIKDIYRDYVNDSYYKKLNVYNADLIYDKFLTPEKINSWVNEHTYKMIPSILDNIDKDFVLGIANAVAIDVKWADSFECHNTISEEFINEDGKTLNVEMMHKTYDSGIKYFDLEGAKGVVIPYETYNTGGKTAMNGTTLEFVGLLPDTNVSDYINKLSNDTFNEIDNNLKELNSNDELKLSLPRFSYNYSLLEFKRILVDLGITDVFSEDKADLTKIMSTDNMKKSGISNLYVDEAIHKTFIELTETGTKAAAVTYFGIKNESMPMPMEKNEIIMEFNKPFIYMIRDKDTKELLFFGVVKSPNEWKGSTCD